AHGLTQVVGRRAGGSLPGGHGSQIADDAHRGAPGAAAGAGVGGAAIGRGAAFWASRSRPMRSTMRSSGNVSDLNAIRTSPLSWALAVALDSLVSSTALFTVVWWSWLAPPETPPPMAPT